MFQSTAIKVSDLSHATPHAFQIRPDAQTLAALSEMLGLDGLRKVLFSGRIAAHGDADWELTGRLGATVVQPCVVTLAPVTTRIETDVRRLFVADYADPEGEEVESPEDDEIEPLGRDIDPGAILAEALSLALPQYPRADGVETVGYNVTEPGKTALTDDDLKPFAGLAALRAQMGDENEE